MHIYAGLIFYHWSIEASSSLSCFACFATRNKTLCSKFSSLFLLLLFFRFALKGTMFEVILINYGLLRCVWFQGTAPPTLNLERPDPAFQGEYMPLSATKTTQIRAALSNSFGFGGTNASLLFSAPP